MRAPAPARGLDHASLRRLIVLFVVDHCSGRGLSHPNFLNMASINSRLHLKMLYVQKIVFLAGGIELAIVLLW